MAELVKNWTNGGSLSVAYDGDGDGTAVISSTENESLEPREMNLSFIDGSRKVVVVRKVVQAAGQVSDGYDVFECTDGSFILSDGLEFMVKK